jgi:hypothetical protein
MGNTSRYGWPWPEVLDPPNLSLYIKNAMQAAETTVGALDDKVNAAAIGGEMVANAAQSLTTGGAVRLSFGAVIQPANGITWNGTNTWTIVTAGVYSVYAQARKSIAAAGDALHIGGTTYTDATLVIPGLATTGYGDVFVSGTRYFAAGTNLCAWYYSASATANTFTTRYPMFCVWKVA